MEIKIFYVILVFEVIVIFDIGYSLPIYVYYTYANILQHAKPVKRERLPAGWSAGNGTGTVHVTVQVPGTRYSTRYRYSTVLVVVLVRRAMPWFFGGRRNVRVTNIATCTIKITA